MVRQPVASACHVQVLHNTICENIENVIAVSRVGREEMADTVSGPQP